MMRCFAAAGEGLSGDMIDDLCLWRGEDRVWRWRCVEKQKEYLLWARVPGTALTEVSLGDVCWAL